MSLPDLPVLAAARGLADAGLLAAFGTALHLSWVLPRGAALRLRWLMPVTLLAAMAAQMPWLLVQAAAVAGSAAPAALADAVAHTAFGRAMGVRIALLAAALGAAAWHRGGLAAVLAAGALVAAGAQAHAAAMQAPALLTVSVLHLLAAGAWVGGLPPLAFVLAREQPVVAQAAARRFSPVGMAAVLAMLGTADWQGWVLGGGLPGLLGTVYGRVLGLKAAGLIALIGLAIGNRRRTALLLRDGNAPLRHAVLVEMAVGLAVVGAAGWLAQLEPGMHQQPLWPFAWAPSLDALEDADIAREVGLAGFVATVALALPPLLLIWRARAAALEVPASALALWLAAPHLRPLLVPAGPYRYWQSPTGFTVTSIAHGAALYPAHCAGCHGADHRGDGPDAKALSVPPADLTAAHLFGHSDGALFGWLTEGIAAPDGGAAMPGFPQLAADARWALIDYVRAYNAGAAGNTRPVRPPELDVLCSDGPHRLADFAGRPIRIVVGAAHAYPGVITILLDAAAVPAPGQCVADDADARRAYAIATGRAALPDGAGALVDAAGWLRLRLDAGDDVGALLVRLAHEPPVRAAAPVAMPPDMRM